MIRWTFYAALALTLIALLTPANDVLSFKAWLTSWLPGANWLDKADSSQHSDKWVHAVMFTVLGWLAMRAWHLRDLRLRWWVTLLGLGAATEVLQTWVPGRSPSLADWLADGLGLAIGTVVGVRAWKNP